MDKKSKSEFIWHKKIEKIGSDKLESQDRLNQIKKEQEANELKKIQKRKLEKQHEREERESFKRKDDLGYFKFKEWKKQEEEFQNKQINLRSKMRIEQGRAKAIDLLVRHIDVNDEDWNIQIYEPFKLINGLTKPDLEDLLGDILSLKNTDNQQFWKDLTIMVQDKLREGKNDINESVLKDATALFKSKTHEQLLKLEQSIRLKVNNENDIDINYWESLLAELKVSIAKTRLKDAHIKVLKQKLDRLKREQSIKASKQEKDANYEPVLLRIQDVPIDSLIITQEEDDDHLNAKQRRVLSSMNDEISGSSLNKVKEENEEETNTIEVPLATENYSWSKEYNPRKPKYKNRVHTGYEWSRYNKKHYDVDNPPPKTVKGYRFSIFYPDMIEKSVSPQYSVKTCPHNKEFAVLRFHAGAPYQDIAFRIANRDWDQSSRHGFRNRFRNGVYQLWFDFKKWKYRR